MAGDLHQWSAYICVPTHVPKVPHIAVIVFRKEHALTPGYDRGDPPYHMDYTEATYYAFASRDEASGLVAAASAIKDITVVCLDVFARLTPTVKTVATLD